MIDINKSLVLYIEMHSVAHTTHFIVFAALQKPFKRESYTTFNILTIF